MYDPIKMKRINNSTVLLLFVAVSNSNVTYWGLDMT